MVEIVSEGLGAALTDEEFDELLRLALDWTEYCAARQQMGHDEVVMAMRFAEQPG